MPEDAPATAEPSVPVVEAEPAPDEPDEAVELTRTGWVRFRYGGRILRLRRPFFGELRSIIEQLVELSDEISDRADDLASLSTRLMEQNAALTDDEALDDAGRRKARRKLTKQSQTAARELTAFSEDARIGWWRQVIETVGVDGELPELDELPAWIADPNLPNKVVQHWRSVPLAPG